MNIDLREVEKRILEKDIKCFSIRCENGRFRVNYRTDENNWMDRGRRPKDYASLSEALDAHDLLPPKQKPAFDTCELTDLLG